MTSTYPSRLRTAALLLSLAFAAGCGESADKMLASAKDYLAKNDPNAAIIQLKNALAKDPNAGEVRFLLGRTLLDGGDAVTAEIELRKALDLKYSADQVVPALARALLAQGQTKKLDELASTPLTSPEGLADLKTSIAQSHAMQGRLDRSRATLQEAIAAKGDFAPALLGMARLKAIDNDLPGAYAIIEEALAKAPQNANAWIFKADLLRSEKKTAAAIAAYQKGIELHPQAILAHAALITMHLQDNQPDLAAKQLAAMEKAAPRSPLTHYMQALAAYGRKDLAAARSASENHLKLQPENPQALQLAGQIAYSSGSDIQAQEYLRKALQKVPELDLSRRTLILSFLRSGQTAKAVELLQPVLQQADKRAAWLPLAGNAYLQAGDVKMAEEHFRLAAQADPANKQAQTALALTRMRTGNAADALAELTQIAADDSDVSADMALIAANMRRNQPDAALKAIANLEKKQPGNPVSHNLRGGVLLGKGDSNGARKSFEQALALNPAFLPAANALAQLDLRENKPDDARKRYESVLATAPKNAAALLALADLRARTGAKPEEIGALIEKAVAASPAEPATRLALIGHFVRVNEPKKALTAVQEALAATAERPELLDAAGRVYQLNGDTNQALAIYGKLASLQPATAHPYLRMAEIQVAANNKEGASNSLRKGLSLQPDSIPMQRALIMLDIDAKQFDAALTKAGAIRKAHPGQTAGHVIEGDIHVINKAWGQAAAAYRAALKIAPTTDIAERIHTALLLDGKDGEANTFADGWLKAQPKDNAFRLFLADSANKRKQYGAAVAQYRTVLAQQPDNPAILNNLAWSLGQMKDPKALSHAEQAFKLAPNQPAIMDTLGTLLVDQGKTERGLELLGKAVQQVPEAGGIRLNLAKALIKAGKKPEARQQLEVLAKLGDNFPAQSEVAALLKGL
jgi:putative PEP-CTERM system TPR-repeat lipoprotein